MFKCTLTTGNSVRQPKIDTKSSLITSKPGWFANISNLAMFPLFSFWNWYWNSYINTGLNMRQQIPANGNCYGHSWPLKLRQFQFSQATSNLQADITPEDILIRISNCIQYWCYYYHFSFLSILMIAFCNVGIKICRWSCEIPLSDWTYLF